MGLGSNKKKAKGKTKAKGDKKYVTVFQILQGREPNEDGSDNMYAKANNYKGRLIWQQFGGDEGDDEDESTFFEIQTAYINRPFKDAPDFVLNTVVVDLNNSKQVVPIDG